MGATSGRARAPHLGPAGRRTAVGTAAAVVGLAVAVGTDASWSVDVLAAWDSAAVAFLALVWPVVATRDAAATAVLAQDEEGSPRASEGLLLGASAASL